MHYRCKRILLPRCRTHSGRRVFHVCYAQREACKNAGTNRDAVWTSASLRNNVLDAIQIVYNDNAVPIVGYNIINFYSNRNWKQRHAAAVTVVGVARIMPISHTRIIHTATKNRYGLFIMYRPRCNEQCLCSVVTQACRR